MVTSQERLIAALQNPLLYDHPVTAFTVLETHISWVILTGEFAYKIKKAVNFGFLDFSTLEKRRCYCQEELRLNRRFAADLYIDVVTVSGSVESPSLRGSGEPLEYAVKMRQFPQEELLSSLASRRQLTAAHIDEIVDLVADIHARIDPAGEDTDYGLPENVHHWVAENFEHIRPALTRQSQRDQLDGLAHWCAQEYRRRRPLLQARKENGFVRECHGDLHLGNLTRISGHITPFDCIEFNPGLRWVDVMSEAAFLVMDIEDRVSLGLAYRFLNGYLQRSGDYAGVRVLRYYLVYRALVRAKVAVLRLGQEDLDAEGEKTVLQDYASYMVLARRYAENRRPALIITQGVSGSGKSWCAARLVERLGAIRVRSDVERKRLYGFGADADTRSGIQVGIYSADASTRTYERLAGLARAIIDGGYPVIVDATFLKYAERERFRGLAGELGAAFVVLHFAADEGTLRARLEARHAAGGDPSEAGVAVLESQLKSQEPLRPDEHTDVIEAALSSDQSVDDLAGRLVAVMSSPA